MHPDYTERFFSDIQASGVKSAERVVPFIVDLLSPSKVIDVGCATGYWLAAFASAGVETVRGLDGDYVDRTSLLIDQVSFTSHDLRRLPLPVDDHYDLAVCLEVAEHLPAMVARSLVAELVRLAPAVLFSAAIPGQGAHGRAVGHVNERWQSYWAELFESYDYRQIDLVRPMFWNDTTIDVIYRQNAFVYTNRVDLPVTVSLPDLIHPDLWKIEVEYHERDHGLRDAAENLVGAFRRKVARTWRSAGRG
jgi:SAM-dependent methyltransferase